jgi:hypothetical protein
MHHAGTSHHTHHSTAHHAMPRVTASSLPKLITAARGRGRDQWRHRPAYRARGGRHIHCFTTACIRQITAVSSPPCMPAVLPCCPLSNTKPMARRAPFYLLRPCPLLTSFRRLPIDSACRATSVTVLSKGVTITRWTPSIGQRALEGPTCIARHARRAGCVDGGTGASFQEPFLSPELLAYLLIPLASCLRLTCT